MATCLLLTALAAQPAAAQLTRINSPANNSVVVIGQSVSLSVTMPTSNTLSAQFGEQFDDYAGATLAVRIEPLNDADETTRDAFLQSGMTIEFDDAFTSDSGVMVRDQNNNERSVFGDGNDGEIRLGNRDTAVLGVASPPPDQTSTFGLTVVFSDEPADGATDIAVPTAADVSAIIAAMRIVIPADSSFEDDLFLRVELTAPAGDPGDPDDSATAQLTVEPPLPEIVITPPHSSSLLDTGGALVVAAATGAVSEVSPGTVTCSGRRCSTPQPYLSDSCDVTLRQALPSACVSADEDGDGRPELSALYNTVTWVVANDEHGVLADTAQQFYIAPVIGFDTALKLIPTTNSAPANFGLAISPPPQGASLGNVAITPRMSDNTVGETVIFSDATTSTSVALESPTPGILTFTFSDITQENVPGNYARLTPAEPDNADNYLYAAGNHEVEIAVLQNGLIRFESAIIPPAALTTNSLVINDLEVSSGSTTYQITDERIEVNVLNNRDAASSVTATVNGNDLSVTFMRGTLREGDIIELALMLVSAGEPASTLRRSLLFPFSSEPIGSGGTLPVRDGQGASTAPIHVAGDAELTFGAWGLHAALQQEPAAMRSAAFSPEHVADETLPPPPSYNNTGIFDFSVRALDNPGDVVTVLMPLLGEVPGGARLSKYGGDDSGEFGWNPFTSSEDAVMPGIFERLWSAAKVAGVCPAIGASRGDDETNAWRPAEGSLSSGDACVLLQLQDGGPNDADGLVNGIIYDPNAVTGGGSGGSGAMDLLLLPILLLSLLSPRLLRRLRFAMPARKQTGFWCA